MAEVLLVRWRCKGCEAVQGCEHDEDSDTIASPDLLGMMQAHLACRQSLVSLDPVPVKAQRRAIANATRGYTYGLTA